MTSPNTAGSSSCGCSGPSAQGAYAKAAAAAEEATDVGRRHHDADLIALGLCSQGRLALYAGRVADGLALLDEAMVRVIAGEASPIIAGHVYCTAIEGCQEISDFGRMAEWTAALERWCSAQPGLLAFTGQCAVHRGQLMRIRGEWSAALDEFELASRRYQQVGSPDAAGLAAYEAGNVHRLRGDWEDADAAYQAAADHGYDPQPGLALLWVACGQVDAARGAIDRLLAEGGGPVQRCRLLPAAVDVLLASGDIERAREEAGEFASLASAFDSVALEAMAAHESGVVELAAGDASGALPYLRKAHQLWAGAASPYERARVQVLMGRALVAVGDVGSSRRELEAARLTFRQLGARPAADEVSLLLAPPTLPAGGLTAREVEVLRLVATGRRNAQIATSPGAEREDRRSPPLQHLQQVGGGLAHRRHGVRLRARAGVKWARSAYDAGRSVCAPLRRRGWQDRPFACLTTGTTRCGRGSPSAPGPSTPPSSPPGQLANAGRLPYVGTPAARRDGDCPGRSKAWLRAWPIRAPPA